MHRRRATIAVIPPCQFEIETYETPAGQEEEEEEVEEEEEEELGGRRSAKAKRITRENPDSDCFERERNGAVGKRRIGGGRSVENDIG